MNFVQLEAYKSPTFFLDPPVDKFFAILGKEKDAVIDGVTDAIQAGFVQTAPIDALDELGGNFNIDKPAPFTDGQYRDKLGHAWDFWRTSGTPARLIKEVNDYGYPNVTIVPQWVEAPPGTFTKTFPGITDPNPDMNIASGAWWSNFYLVIDFPHPSFVKRKWGTPESGKWLTGDSFGTYKWGTPYGDLNIIGSLKKLIRKLKPAWTSCRGIIFVLAGGTFWGNFNWGDGTTYGGGISEYAHYPLVEEWEE